MARGWESKSVEMQMEERERPGKPTDGPPRDPAAERELQVLILTRTRLLHEIDNVNDLRLKELKRRALAHIEGRIRAQSLAVGIKPPASF